MKKFIKNLFKEIVYLIILIIIFVLYLILSSFTILSDLNFVIYDYLIIIAHFIAIYIIFKIFFYFLNKEINIDKKLKNKIYLMILGILILFVYFCSLEFNILNPIKYILDIFNKTIIFKVFPYISYLILIGILVLIYLLVKLINIILNEKNNIKNEKKEKTLKKENKEIRNNIFKYVLLILISLLMLIGIGLKIYRLNSIYIVNLDDNDIFFSEIINSYKGKYFIRTLDLSNIDKEEKEKKLIRSLINNESETFIVIPEDFTLSMERASVKKDKYNTYNKEILFLTNKSKNSNLEYLILLNKIRENAIVYERYGDFTKTKDIINKINLEREIKIKIEN